MSSDHHISAILLGLLSQIVCSSKKFPPRSHNNNVTSIHVILFVYGRNYIILVIPGL